MALMYPYLLEIYKNETSIYVEETGKFLKTGGQWLELSECRDESNGSQKAITTDGQQYIYSGTIYLPNEGIEIPKGSKVRVVDEKGNVRIEGNIKQQKGEINHLQLWI